MRISALYKKGRLSYPIELVNAWVDPLNGRMEFKDAHTGDWIPQKYIRKPKLLEGAYSERNRGMVRALFSQLFSDYNRVG